MNPSEIISQNVEAHGGDAQQIMRWIAGHVNRGNAHLIQHGDSVLLIKLIAPHEVELHLYTIERPLALVQSIRYFLQKLQESDIMKMYGKADNPEIIKLIQLAGVQVQNSDRPEYNWMSIIKE